MRTRRDIAVMAAAAALAASLARLDAQQDPLTYETPRWIFSGGDLGGASADGRADVALVDKSSGTITLGLQRADGGFDWTAPEPTGIAAPTGLAVGRFNNVPASQVAVTAPGENRISLFTPSDAVTPLGIRHAYPSLMATRSVAAFLADGDGVSDLLGAGDIGGTGSHFYWQVTANLHATPSALWSEVSTAETARVWALRQKTATPPVAAAVRGSQFLVANVGAGGTTSTRVLAGFTATPATQMTYGNYNATALAQVILYSPGQGTARTAKVTEPAPGNFSWGALSTLTFPKPVQLIVTVPSASGARLAVLFSDTSAATFDFNGTVLVPRSALPGSGYELLAPLGTHGLLSIDSAGAWQRWDVSSASPTLTATHLGAFPAASPSADVSNVIFVSGGEPFVHPDAAPVFLGHVRDWTTAATGAGSNWSVTSLTQGLGGLGAPATVDYKPVPGADFALVNQLKPNISIRTLAASAGPNVGDVFITPPGGTYPPLAAGEEFIINFTSTMPGSLFAFRLAPGAAWSLYNPNSPPSISAPATVQVFAQSGSQRTPTRSATYSFAAESPLATGQLVDADLDGLPDGWEQAFAAFDPTGDEDGDGSENLSEFQNDTDPRDPASFLPGGAIVLHAEVVGSGPTLALRLSWPLSDTASVLQSSPALGAWSDITDGITSTDAGFIYDFPLTGDTPARAFFRLKRPGPVRRERQAQPLAQP